VKLLDQLYDKARKEGTPRPVPAELDREIVNTGMASLEKGVARKGVAGPAISPEKRAEALKMVQEGKTVKQASAATGIKAKTLYAWIRRQKVRQAKQKKPEVEGAPAPGA
jgi:DNA invertase Pin-like site-specific DNA recombinase